MGFKVEKLWSNELIKTAIILAILVTGTIGFMLGLRTVLRIDNPLMVVASESMVPTLNIGDIIVVRGELNVSEIKASPIPEGDIIVFREPGSPGNLIVHRATDRATNGFETKGDNNR